MSDYRLYHNSSKLLLPLMTASIGLESMDYSYKNTFHVMNICNLGYHSHYSCASVIHDYIKNRTANDVLRLMNAKMHLLATIGFMAYLYK